MPRLHLAVLVGLTLAATTARAQNVTVQATEPYAPGAGTVTAYGYYMSPYSGTVNGTTERLNCIDFFHDVTMGETWTAAQTNLGAAISNTSLLTATRDGSNGLLTNPTSVLNTYEQVAWLTAQMPADPASNPNESTAIQTAIWYIASNAPGQLYSSTGDLWNNGATTSLVSNGVGSTGYWVDQATSQYANYGASYYSNFNILTDVNKASAGSAQEFIYSTAPEPGTMTLVATGFLAVVGAGVRRRRNAVEL